MKTLKNVAFAALCGVAALTVSSCEDLNNHPDNVYMEAFRSVTAFNEYDYWTYCYQPAYQNTLSFGGEVSFSHSTSSTLWDGVYYYDWGGFCPSRSTDTDDYTRSGNWIDHQWSAITGVGIEGLANYMVGFCSATETAADAATSTQVVIRSEKGTFRPYAVFVTNTTYGYYSMLNGSAFNRKFGKGDWCKLNFTAVTGNQAGVTKSVYLADFRSESNAGILDRWQSVSLEELGECDRVVVTMESSDTGEWGMNNPAYFCLGAFWWKRVTE